MSEFVNNDILNFSNDASASSFGWNFQSNAGIFLFLKYIKESESIKVESRLQDIEIKLTNGKKVLAQAKSAQDYSIVKNKKEKFKDAIVSFARNLDDGAQLIYISNIPDTFDSAKDMFNNKIVPFSSCLQSTKDEINKIFDSLINSLDKEIESDNNEKRRTNKRKIKNNIEKIDKNNINISVVYPYIGDGENRYSVIKDSILEFLVNIVRLSRQDAITICQRLMEHWQLALRHNSTIKDGNITKVISKKDFIWPIVIFISDEVDMEIDDCLSYIPDVALKNEVHERMMSSNMLYHERFEFSNRVLQEYSKYKKSLPINTKDIEKAFIKENGMKFVDEFKEYQYDEELVEYITKAFVYRILINNRDIVRIRHNTGVSL